MLPHYSPSRFCSNLYTRVNYRCEEWFPQPLYDNLCQLFMKSMWGKSRWERKAFQNQFYIFIKSFSSLIEYYVHSAHGIINISQHEPPAFVSSICTMLIKCSIRPWFPGKKISSCKYLLGIKMRKKELQISMNTGSGFVKLLIGRIARSYNFWVYSETRYPRV